MNSSVYPTNFDFSDDYFSYPTTFVDDSWDFPASNDTQCMDVFEVKFEDTLSDTLLSDEEVVATPPPSSPVPHPEPVQMEVDHLVQLRNQTLFAQYQQQLQQYQLFLQQKLLMSLSQPPLLPMGYAPAPSGWLPPVAQCPPCKQPKCEVVSVTSHQEPSKPTNNLDSCLTLTSLDTNHFGTYNVSMTKLKSIPVDVSGNLSDSQYNKIFKKYHLQLQLDSHPTMTEQDLEDIKVHGRMYFLKNVKTIVPKIGPWKFNAHISHRRTDERQYNIPGMAVTCKVKEWLTDDGLWRLYHFKKGKTVKTKKLYE